MKLESRRPWHGLERFRFPFVSVSMPSLGRVETYFRMARDQGFYSNFGPVSFALEEALNADLLRSGRAVTCASCTSGLTAALTALRVKGPVLVASFTFPATVSAVRAAGLVPIAVDVGPDGIVSTVDIVETARRSRADAVVAVRPYGIWTDLGEIARTCRRAGLALVIDNAAGLGVQADTATSFGVPEAIEVFSLHATKPFGVGEGGIILTPPHLENDIRSALNFGLWEPGTLAPGVGTNGKMSELNAAMALTILEDLPERVRGRQAMVAQLCHRVARIDRVRAWQTTPHASAWQCFPVQLTGPVDVPSLVEHCAILGLQIRRYYYPNLIDNSNQKKLRNACGLARNAVCLPVYDRADADTVDQICDIFQRALSLCRTSKPKLAAARFGEGWPAVASGRGLGASTAPS